MTRPALCSPPFPPALFDRLLALNNAHARELAFETASSFCKLLAVASHVRAEPEGLALLVGMDETCPYDNPNFAWLRARYAKFYYVDRVVVDKLARGRNLARQLYAELAERTISEGRERLVCEINSAPPNPASDAFHAGLGFMPVGQRELPGGKVVRYWAKDMA